MEEAGQTVADLNLKDEELKNKLRAIMYKHLLHPAALTQMFGDPPQDVQKLRNRVRRYIQRYVARNPPPPAHLRIQEVVDAMRARITQKAKGEKSPYTPSAPAAAPISTSPARKPPSPAAAPAAKKPHQRSSPAATVAAKKPHHPISPTSDEDPDAFALAALMNTTMNLHADRKTTTRNILVPFTKAKTQAEEAKKKKERQAKHAIAQETKRKRHAVRQAATNAADIFADIKLGT